jgi:hypothetical protein
MYISDEELREMKARLAVATQGPYVVHQDGHQMGPYRLAVLNGDEFDSEKCVGFMETKCKKDAIFAAHAWVDQGRLIQEVECLLGALYTIANLDDKDSFKHREIARLAITQPHTERRQA